MRRFTRLFLILLLPHSYIMASHPLIILIGHSRSCSTIFERAIYERNDLVCLHEPFSYQYFLERDGEINQDNKLFEAEYYIRDFQSLITKIEDLRKQSPVFIKELGIGSLRMLKDEYFLSMKPMTFIILFRHPLKTLLSLSKLDPNYPDALNEYSALYNCVQHLLQRGLKVIFIQSENFVQNPEYFLLKIAEMNSLFPLHGTSNFKLPPPQAWKNHYKWCQKAITSSSIKSSLENTYEVQSFNFIQNDFDLNNYWQEAYKKSLFYYFELLKISKKL